VEGIVDLAFLDDKEWLVLDFKTDQDVKEALDAYSRQVGMYATAVSTATGQRARGALFIV
jgi:ATP-dependent exoDNAse (exonuclease V) beta subunit